MTAGVPSGQQDFSRLLKPEFTSNTKEVFLRLGGGKYIRQDICGFPHCTPQLNTTRETTLLRKDVGIEPEHMCFNGTSKTSWSTQTKKGWIFFIPWACVIGI